MEVKVEDISTENEIKTCLTARQGDAYFFISMSDAQDGVYINAKGTFGPIDVIKWIHQLEYAHNTTRAVEYYA